MNTILSFLITRVVVLLAGISATDWDKIKQKVLYYETQLLPKEEKHGKVVKFINDEVKAITGTLVDWLVKMAVLWVRNVMGTK